MSDLTDSPSATRLLRHIILCGGITPDHPAWGGLEFSYLLKHQLVDVVDGAAMATHVGLQAIRLGEQTWAAAFAPNASQELMDQFIRIDSITADSGIDVLIPPLLKPFRIGELYTSGDDVLSHFTFYTQQGWVTELLLEQPCLLRISEYTYPSDAVRVFTITLNPLANARHAYLFLSALIEREIDKAAQRDAAKKAEQS